MIRYSQADRVTTAGHLGSDAFGVAPHDESERSRPEGAGERTGAVGYVDRELVELLGPPDVHDHRMVGRAALDREQTLHGLRVRRVGAETVDGLRREGDEVVERATRINYW